MKLATGEKLEGLQQITSDVQRLDAVRISEPRIELVIRRLEALLRVVQLESNGKPVEVNGFRLRDPSQWMAPQPPAFSELWHISNACNMRCPFCYEEGDPEGCSTLNEPSGMTTVQEIDTRIELRAKSPGQGIFRPLTYTNEIFCNPHAMDIIERLRDASPPGEVLTFVTNGTYLTRDVVKRLARMRPIFFNFSVNSLSPDIRSRILRDPEPETAIRAIELLREHEIPYLGSLVCWPSIPWEDIEATVRGLDRMGCAIVRYSLSAYSKHLKARKFDREEFWSQGLELARRLMRETSTPIKVEPWQYHDPTYLPNPAGTIQGSPSAASGLRGGDRILRVGQTPVPSANHALTALAAASRVSRGIEITVQRNGGEPFVVRLENNEKAATPGYPYNRLRDLPGFDWGLIIIESLRFGYLKQVRESIARAGARRALICSSELMRPVVEQMIADSDAFRGLDVALGVPENQYFGGTIVIGDLLVVDDYVAYINRFVERNGPVDLVLIPSSPFSLGAWSRDLTGTPWTEIARRTGCRVELIMCHPLNG